MNDIKIKPEEKVDWTKNEIIIKKPKRNIVHEIDFIPSSATLSSKVIEHEIDRLNKGFRNRLNKVTPSEIWIG